MNNIKELVYIAPFGYNVHEKLLQPDKSIHGGQAEADMLNRGGKFVIHDFPDDFETAKGTVGSNIHYETIRTMDGKRYMPLFTSYRALINIFGENIRISLICFATAEKLCVKEQLSGIVIGPGDMNIIIPADKIERI